MHPLKLSSYTIARQWFVKYFFVSAFTSLIDVRCLRSIYISFKSAQDGYRNVLSIIRAYVDHVFPISITRMYMFRHTTCQLACHCSCERIKSTQKCVSRKKNSCRCEGATMIYWDPPHRTDVEISNTLPSHVRLLNTSSIAHQMRKGRVKLKTESEFVSKRNKMESVFVVVCDQR